MVVAAVTVLREERGSFQSLTVLIRSWDVTPKLTDQEFSFTPPKGAKKIEFLQLTAEAKPK
jgi:hypothetical protein